jgi:hypothetical protein
LGEGRKRFFFEKKKQKTFDCFRPRRWNACARCADLDIVSNIAAKTGHARLTPARQSMFGKPDYLRSRLARQAWMAVSRPSRSYGEAELPKNN